jgi:hypothetical protein
MFKPHIVQANNKYYIRKLSWTGKKVYFHPAYISKVEDLEEYGYLLHKAYWDTDRYDAFESDNIEDIQKLYARYLVELVKEKTKDNLIKFL